MNSIRIQTGLLPAIAFLVSAVLCGTISQAQESERKQSITRDINITEENGNKRVVVKETIAGKTTETVYEGEEAEAFIEEQAGAFKSHFFYDTSDGGEMKKVIMQVNGDTDESIEIETGENGNVIIKHNGETIDISESGDQHYEIKCVKAGDPGIHRAYAFVVSGDSTFEWESHDAHGQTKVMKIDLSGLEALESLEALEGLEGLEALESLESLEGLSQLEELDGILDNMSFDIEITGDGDHETIIINSDDQGTKRVIREEVRVGSAAEAEELLRELEIETEGVSFEDEDGNPVKAIVVQKKIIIEDVPAEDTGMDAMQLDMFRVYPNPNDGMFTVAFTPAKSGKTQITLTDSRGVTVLEDEYNGKGAYMKDVDLGSGASGIYFLNVVQGKSTITKKVVID